MRLSFYWMGAAAWVLKVDEALIGSDPALAPAGTTYPFGRRLSQPRPPVRERDQIGCWLLTHNHKDHIDPEGLDFISPAARIIAQPGLAPLLAGRFSEVTYLDWGQEAQVSLAGLSLTVRAVPGFHGASQEIIQALGPVNGYLLRLAGDGESLSVYVTSDSLPDPRIDQALAGQAIDLLIANLGSAYASRPGGPVTMSPAMLRDMAGRLRPRRIIPVHLTAFSHWEMKDSDLEALADLPGLIRPPLGEWLSLEDF